MGRREAFDPLRSYVANKTFAYGKFTFNDGDPFTDRSDMRRFRQLYDARYLRMAEEGEGAAPDFKVMNEGQLRQWLIDAGNPSLAHERTPHFRLVERCRRVWQEQRAAEVAQAGAAPAPAGAPKARERVRVNNGVSTRKLRQERSGKGVQGAPTVRRAASRNRVQRERVG